VMERAWRNEIDSLRAERDAARVDARAGWECYKAAVTDADAGWAWAERLADCLPGEQADDAVLAEFERAKKERGR
jgi:hypothetical protein